MISTDLSGMKLSCRVSGSPNRRRFIFLSSKICNDIRTILFQLLIKMETASFPGPPKRPKSFRKKSTEPHFLKGRRSESGFPKPTLSCLQFLFRCIDDEVQLIFSPTQERHLNVDVWPRMNGVTRIINWPIELGINFYKIVQLGFFSRFKTVPVERTSEEIRRLRQQAEHRIFTYAFSSCYEILRNLIWECMAKDSFLFCGSLRGRAPTITGNDVLNAIKKPL